MIILQTHVVLVIELHLKFIRIKYFQQELCYQKV